jgi:hypothetical protein
MGGKWHQVPAIWCPLGALCYMGAVLPYMGAMCDCTGAICNVWKRHDAIWNLVGAMRLVLVPEPGRPLYIGFYSNMLRLHCAPQWQRNAGVGLAQARMYDLMSFHTFTVTVSMVYRTVVPTNCK